MVSVPRRLLILLFFCNAVPNQVKHLVLLPPPLNSFLATFPYVQEPLPSARVLLPTNSFHLLSQLQMWLSESYLIPLHVFSP